MNRREEENKIEYELEAELGRILSSPTRIEIIYALRSGRRSVAELGKMIDTPLANLFQHLTNMKLHGILKSTKKGTTVYYYLACPKMLEACDLMRQVLTEVLMENEMTDLVDQGK